MAGYPLAGMSLPAGDPGAVRGLAYQYRTAAKRLATSAETQRHAGAGTIGSTWIGDASTTAKGTLDALASAGDRLSTAASDTATILDHLATSWENAQTKWKQAEHLAHSAMQQEAQHVDQAEQRALEDFGHAPPAHLAAITQRGYDWQSPDRATAISVGHDAIDDWNDASKLAVARLNVLRDEITLQIPNVTPPRVHYPWWDWGPVRWLANHPNVDDALLRMLEMSGGLSLMGLGGGGEAGGGLLDLTGLGAFIGVPVNALSGAAIGTGGGLVWDGAKGFGDDIGRLFHAASDSSSSEPHKVGDTDGGPGEWVEVNRKGGSDRSWEYQWGVSGTRLEYRVDVPGHNPVFFDDYRDGELIDAKGPGWEGLFKSGEGRYPHDGAVEDIFDAAFRQTRAANGIPIVWYVAEPNAASYIEQLLSDQDYDIRVVVREP